MTRGRAGAKVLRQVQRSRGERVHGKTEECERGHCGWAVSRAERYPGVVGSDRLGFGFSSKRGSHWVAGNEGTTSERKHRWQGSSRGVSSGRVQTMF